ncbi:hypothetical protein AB833_04520 [Chromatiales bacterium (ex Bugula neritina AB1)]|nr:hypothetical protein AB833_04520 [Chromatiales bacterium (ex Bugula neritina AB1)]
MTDNKKRLQNRPVQISGGVVAAGTAPVSGVIHVIRNEEEVQRFREGEILVASATSPAWLEIFPLAKAIIAEEDGWMSHAAVVARAYDIVGLINVPGATEHLRSGDIIQIDANGLIERLSNRREPDSPMRVSVPAAVRARGIEIDQAVEGNVVSIANRLQKPEDLTDLNTSVADADEDQVGNG